MASRIIRTTRRTDLAPILAGFAPFANATRSLQGGTVEAFAADCFGRSSGWLAGDDLDRWREDRDDVEYVVTSYATPIGWHTPNGGWYVVEQRFSQTTSVHQGQLRRGLARSHAVA